MNEMEPKEDRKHRGEMPDFTAWEEPSEAISGDCTRDDFLDVALQLREPSPVSEIAERADRGKDSAREYMRFFEEMGVVEKAATNPEQYQVNRDYLEWRQIRRITEEYGPDEIAGMLSEVVDRIEELREEFEADSPEKVSVSNHAEEHEEDVEEVWQKVSEWKTLRKQRRLLDEGLRKTENTVGQQKP
jgi:predicted transcriptional regulator